MSGEWIMITFGAGLPNWRAAAQRLGRQAEETGWFGEIHVYDERRLAADFPDFVRCHRDVLRARVRGFGYWIWKPYLIWKTLESARVTGAAGVVYLDAGYELNAYTQESRQRLQEYLRLAQERHVFAMHLPMHPEDHWTKGSVLNRLSLSSTLRNAPQIQAHPTFSNSRIASDIAQEWYETCVADNYDLVLDPPPGDVIPPLVAHRHDQSVFSCLMKARGIPTIPDETFWAPDWTERGAAYPLWAMRNRTGVLSTQCDVLSRARRFRDKAYSRAYTELFIARGR